MAPPVAWQTHPPQRSPEVPVKGLRARPEGRPGHEREMGVERYRWSTSGDERVRPTHQSNSGRVFRWDSPPADTGHPGSDVMCRCGAEALFD